MVVLRRVQPHRAGSSFGDRPADPVHPDRHQPGCDAVLLRWHRADAEPDVHHLHYNEPGVRRTTGTTRQPQGLCFVFQTPALTSLISSHLTLSHLT